MLKLYLKTLFLHLIFGGYFYYLSASKISVFIGVFVLYLAGFFRAYQLAKFYLDTLPFIEAVNFTNTRATQTVFAAIALIVTFLITLLAATKFSFLMLFTLGAVGLLGGVLIVMCPALLAFTLAFSKYKSVY